MQCQLRSNGKIEIELKPATPIEQAFVEAIAIAAKKGSTVAVAGSESGGLILSIENN